MISNDFIRNLSARAAELFPAAGAMRDDLEKRLNELLQSSFARLNLVTREEFDSQREVLERAQGLVRELDRKVSELEAKIEARAAAAGSENDQP